METIDNIKLIENGLKHVEFELNSNKPSLFRVLRESHLVFYRAMVETLRGTSNALITGRIKDKSRECFYQRGSDGWKVVKKGDTVQGCKQAWRYTAPADCDKPELPEQQLSDEAWIANQKWLLGFYDALAMIQSESFMRTYIGCKEVEISDEELSIMEWGHEDIRNNYEHYVPKVFCASVQDLRSGSILFLQKSLQLLFSTGLVTYPNPDLPEKIKLDLESVVSKLTKLS